MISIKVFVFNELGVNSYILYDETGECLIVDPGCTSEVMCGDITTYISKKKLTPVYIINTHGHFDHVAGNAYMKKEYGCPLILHNADLFLLKSSPGQASLFGLKVEPSPVPEIFTEDGEIINFGNSKVKILHVPGHSPGSICLHSADDKMLISGDVLFNGSVGRTDLFGGNHDQLIAGIASKLMILPGDTAVYPGHGTATTIGREHDANPFLN